MSAQERLARRREFHLKLKSKLQPHQELIEYIDAVLVWENVIQYAILFVLVNAFLWLIDYLITSCTLTTLLCLVFGIYVTGVKFSKYPPKFTPKLPLETGTYRHSFDQIILFFVDSYFAVVEFFEDINDRLKSSDNYIILCQIILSLVLFGFIGSLISTYTIIFLLVNTLLVLPGCLAHSVHKKAYAAAEPHLNKAKVALEPHLTKAYAAAEPHLNKAKTTLEPHWKTLEPHIQPLLQKLSSNTANTQTTTTTTSTSTPTATGTTTTPAPTTTPTPAPTTTTSTSPKTQPMTMMDEKREVEELKKKMATEEQTQNNNNNNNKVPLIITDYDSDKSKTTSPTATTATTTTNTDGSDSKMVGSLSSEDFFQVPRD